MLVEWKSQPDRRTARLARFKFDPVAFAEGLNEADAEASRRRMAEINYRWARASFKEHVRSLRPINARDLSRD